MMDRDPFYWIAVHRGAFVGYRLLAPASHASEALRGYAICRQSHASGVVLHEKVTIQIPNLHPLFAAAISASQQNIANAVNLRAFSRQAKT